MANPVKSAEKLQTQLTSHRGQVTNQGEASARLWKLPSGKDGFVGSARNLSNYLALRRGDLAVEIGFLRIAEIQEELLWICEAAHVPVIWATQVLENMAKKGVPSRAEITDAAMSELANYVMLSKGPYVVEAVSVLDAVLRRIQEHQLKKCRSSGNSNPGA